MDATYYYNEEYSRRESCGNYMDNTRCVNEDTDDPVSPYIVLVYWLYALGIIAVFAWYGVMQFMKWRKS